MIHNKILKPISQVESFCATYNADVFVVVYSVEDRQSLKAAEDILLYLWKGDYMLTRGVILVANKADLERKREVPMVGEYKKDRRPFSCTYHYIFHM